MDINKLKHFKSIYEERSLTRASENIGLSKTALSLSLKSLEKTLGLNLFVRTNKQMLPTGDGEFLYQKISPILTQLKDLHNEVLNQKTEYSGEIRIGAPQCFGSEFLVPFLRDFKKTLPDVNLKVTLDNGTRISSDLSKGLLDFAIIGDDIFHQVPSSVHLEKLFDYELVLCCSQDYFKQFLAAESLTYEHLINLDFVSLSHVPASIWFEKNFSRRIEPKKNYILNNHHAHINELLLSGGLGLQARYSVEKYLEAGQLVEIPQNQNPIFYNFYSAQLYNQVPKRVLKVLVSEFRNSLSTYT